MRRSSLLLLAGACSFPIVAALPLPGCSSNTNPPVIRSFQRPENVDVLCMQVLDGSGNAIKPIPVTQDHCAPVPPNVTGSGLPFHLYALVTQETLGEVAVVDLTAGWVVDEDRATPGLNFIPVGGLPAGVVASPDGQMAYVASAEPNKAAVYTIPAVRMLGDSQGQIPLVDGGRPTYTPALTLPELPVCELPQPPVAIAIVKTSGPDAGSPSAADGGDAGEDASEDGGATGIGDAGSVSGPAIGYELVVVMRATAGAPASVALIDPSSMAASAGQSVPGVKAGPTGMVSGCAILGQPVPLSAALPTMGWASGPAWSDGVLFVDGGVSLADAEPPPSPAPVCTATPNDGLPDGGFGYLQGPAPTGAIVRNDEAHLLYVADGALPLIHVFDVSSYGPPVEQAPLLATSSVSPARRVQVGAIALSPVTSRYERFLYAIDKEEGSIMVYDVSDPVNGPHVPLTRPNPELNPFQEPDRIAFSSPVASVAFARHDWPLAVDLNGNSTSVVQTGVLCNPNPNAHPTSTLYRDYGAFYRADVTIPSLPVPLGPARLRGIFAFAALSNGALETIDVDDWDAPCRRPDPMDPADQISDLSVAEPDPAGPADFDPYHVPHAYDAGPDKSLANGTPVSLESFYPVSAPHRARTATMLRNDPSLGNHAPNIVVEPVLTYQHSTLATGGVSGTANAMMLPTVPVGTSLLADPAEVSDPTAPDPAARGSLLTPPIMNASWATYSLPYISASPTVRFSYEDPLVHSAQTWTVTYEGRLPTISGVVGTFVTNDGYQTLTLSAPGAYFCNQGIEDRSIAASRIAEAQAEATRLGLHLPTTMSNWVGDYVEVTDDLLDSTDPYWSETESGGPDGGLGCWDGWLGAESQTATDRFNACNAAFGAASNADQTYSRDFPILSSTNDALTLGRFAWNGDETPESRTIVGADPSNADVLKQLQCCFHHQAQFAVRTGGEWVATGSSTGLLHHVVSDGGVCSLSSDPNDALKNSRSFGIDRVWSGAGGSSTCGPIDPTTDAGVEILTHASDIAPDRNSPLALRNPMFSYIMWNGCPSEDLAHGVYTTNLRDEYWQFVTGGSYTPQTLPLSGGSGTPVSPQSMLFIDSLGQLAIVDGLAQGLILVDLNLLQFAHAPYY